MCVCARARARACVRACVPGLSADVPDSRAPDGSRAGLLSYHGTTYRAGPEQFSVLAAEREVHLRVLVDRVIVPPPLRDLAAPDNVYVKYTWIYTYKFYI